MSILPTKNEFRLIMNLRGLPYLLTISLSVSILLSLLTACGKKEGHSNILSHEEMVRILSDVYVTEQKVTKTSLRFDSAKVVFARMKTKVFERSGVSDSIFKLSFDYYVEHPKELEEIYTTLVDSLSLKEQQLDVMPLKDSVAKQK